MCQYTRFGKLDFCCIYCIDVLLSNSIRYFYCISRESRATDRDAISFGIYIGYMLDQKL